MAGKKFCTLCGSELHAIIKYQPEPIELRPINKRGPESEERKFAPPIITTTWACTNTESCGVQYHGLPTPGVDSPEESLMARVEKLELAARKKRTHRVAVKSHI